MSNGCTTSDSDDSQDSLTNQIVISPTPTHPISTPTLSQLAGMYRSQDPTFHGSTIQIFSDGEFLWHSRTQQIQIFHGQIYDLDANGFSVKLSDGSGDSFHFQFTSDKRGFWSLDESGNQIEEYLP